MRFGSPSAMDRVFDRKSCRAPRITPFRCPRADSSFVPERGVPAGLVLQGDADVSDPVRRRARAGHWLSSEMAVTQLGLQTLRSRQTGRKVVPQRPHADARGPPRRDIATHVTQDCANQLSFQLHQARPRIKAASCARCTGRALMCGNLAAVMLHFSRR